MQRELDALKAVMEIKRELIVIRASLEGEHYHDLRQRIDAAISEATVQIEIKKKLAVH